MDAMYRQKPTAGQQSGNLNALNFQSFQLVCVSHKLLN